MRFVAGALLAVAATVGVAHPDRAHACSFAGPGPHTIDPAMVGVDQTPPTLPQPVVAEINHNDPEGCMERNSCQDIVSARITNLATDDTSSPDQIGYRFAVVVGTPPAGFSLPTGTARMPIYDGSFYLHWTAGQDVDVTLNLFAVDAAGNQSAPRTLRVHEDTGACSVARGQRAGVPTLAVAIAALALAAVARRRRRTVGALLAIAVFAAVAWPSRAHACDPFWPEPHTVDPAMVGVDQTPPQLQQPTVAAIQHNDTGDGCATPKCGWSNSVAVTTPATDDMTPADRIGYRVTTVAGTAPASLTPSGTTTVAGGGTLWLFWDGDADVDFTLQLIAVDAAGNESLPQTVRIHDDTGGCSVGRRYPTMVTLTVVMLALATAARRRPRQRT